MTHSKPARKPRLKVYRTEAGFHDAYVAAPNMKAALMAWGARGDLFRQRAAQVITDPALTGEPLSKPGQIILRRRGPESGLPVQSKISAPRREKRKPAPSRKRLDSASAAVEAFDMQAARQLKEIDQRIANLEKRRRDLVRSHQSRRRSLKRRQDDARQAYEAALATLG